MFVKYTLFFIIFLVYFLLQFHKNDVTNIMSLQTATQLHDLIIEVLLQSQYFVVWQYYISINRHHV